MGSVRRPGSSATASGARCPTPSSARRSQRSLAGSWISASQPGDRVALLCTTRVEWTYADFAITSAGAVVVPIYPTNSPEECAWVAGNSESRFVVCEDAEQVAKIAAVRAELPKLEAIISIEPGVEGTISLDELRERGRGA